MPQALGFSNWQALYDDNVSKNGVIAEVALRFEASTASSRTLSFKGQPIRGRHHLIWNTNTLDARDRIVHSQPVGTASPRLAQGSELLSGWFCPTGPVVDADCCSSGDLSPLSKWRE